MYPEEDGERVVSKPLHRGPTEGLRQVAVAVQGLNLQNKTGCLTPFEHRLTTGRPS